MDTEFPRFRGEGPSRKIMEIPGGGGGYREAPWNGKFWGLGGETGKTLRGGSMDIFWNHTI